MKSTVLRPNPIAVSLARGPSALAALALASFLGAALTFGAGSASAADPWVVYEGKPGLPGSGKKVVLLSGDEEYRSEEAMPQLGKILSQHHGFDCVVTFSVDPESGLINPNNQSSTPGLHHLDDADLCIMFWRFRQPSAEEGRHLESFIKAGKPIIGLRTSTHPINVGGDSPWAAWSFNSGAENWVGGFGQQILGDPWINHHGNHKSEATRGIVNEEHADHPILRGIDDLFGPTDVYGIRNLPDSATVLVHGQVLEGMKPDDKPVEGPKNDPMQPVSWIKSYQVPGGEKGTAICSTFFSSKEMECEDIRRFIVNSAYWLTGLGGRITADLDVDPVGDFAPSMYGFHDDQHWKDKAMKPSDFALEE